MNRLAHETSPYLLQHASNPVDWYPWGDDAFQTARERDCPIFLSIGYSACHWCHVMEHESFDNADIARLMNETFVNIKVDREERPDLDQIYMSSVMALTGRGGWPMSVFLTPELKPFFGGTYWPPDARMGMPGFRQIVSKIGAAWRQRRDDIEDNSRQLAAAVIQMSVPAGRPGEPDDKLLSAAMSDLLQAADARFGGFGGAPKFPHAMDLRLLLRLWVRFQNSEALQVSRFTCDRMAAGGIYDHLGGGFHRYSTDARWLVPHFEKMLYDNALLTSAYAELLQITGSPEHERVLTETLDYVLREMTLDSGSFCSTQDADSEGEEGRFFVWSLAEVTEVLGIADAKLFAAAYDVTQAGNWEGSNILNRPRPLKDVADDFRMTREELVQALAPLKQRLFDVRKQRTAPGTDDKIITAWNGMMISGMSLASRVLGEPRYWKAAGRAADDILQNLRADDGRLFHTARHGRPSIRAFADDYACLIDGLVELYQATFDESRIDQGAELADLLLADFFDESSGGFFYTAETQSTPITRIRDSQDGATPSANSMAATALLKLSVLTGRSQYRDAAESTLKMLDSQLRKSPMSGGQSLIAVDHAIGPMPEVVIQLPGDNWQESQTVSFLRRRFAPGLMLAVRTARHRDSPALRSALLDPLFEGRDADPSRETIWVCQRGRCREPVNAADDVRRVLDGILPLPESIRG
ncbi:MAG: thioredoxin domain-containing protein [Planctomycetaceae bacterium]